MHADTADYRIERLSPDNLNDLGRLYHAVYGDNRTAPDFQKKYATAYTGATYIGYFAYDQQGTPAAYYGVMPCFIEYDNNLVLVAQSGDTMTHPDHRNRRLFARLCGKTIELCRHEHILLIFGFPNQNSKGINGQIGWTTTGNLEGFRIPVTTLPIRGLTRRLPFLQHTYRTYCRALLKKYLLPEKGIPNSALENNNPGGSSHDNPADPDNHFGGIHRDEAWFNYKTYSKTSVIRLGKATAWIAISDTITIGDIRSAGQPLTETLRRLRNLAARLGIRQIVFHTSPGTSLHQQFAAGKYPSFSSFPALFNDLGSGIPLHQLKFTLADIDTF
ncbi:MAG: GNAT family N-acetyltransferase [Bacteroidetes bacterium]|nr:GNAT family N-acetyltransferase [Bacteroidota bacterium]